MVQKIIVCFGPFGFGGIIFTKQSQWFLTGFVHGNYFKHALRVESNEVYGQSLIGRVGNLAFEVIGFEVIVCGVGGLESYVFRR